LRPAANSNGRNDKTQNSVCSTSARAALQSAPLPALSFTALYYQLGKPQASATKGIIRRSKNISLRV
jgi:hypothetical protein